MITFKPVVDRQVKQRLQRSPTLKSSNVQIHYDGRRSICRSSTSDTQSKEDALRVTIRRSSTVLATYTNGAYGGQCQTAKRYSTTLAPNYPKGALSQMSVDDASK